VHEGARGVYSTPRGASQGKRGRMTHRGIPDSGPGGPRRVGRGSRHGCFMLGLFEQAEGKVGWMRDGGIASGSRGRGCGHAMYSKCIFWSVVECLGGSITW